MKAMMYSATLWLHLVAGFVVLVAFWVPALTKKGSRVHRAAGKVFLLAMLVVIVTGLPLAARLFFVGQWIFGVFLSYLVVLISASTASAWFAIQLKHAPDRYYSRPYRLTAWLLVASGASVSAIGYWHEVWLLFFFGMIGPFASLDMFRNLRVETRRENWWLHEHFGGMIGGGIAAHIAFGAFGLRGIWPAYASVEGWIGMLPWMAPLVAGIAASAWLTRKYSQRASSRAAVRPG